MTNTEYLSGSVIPHAHPGLDAALLCIEAATLATLVSVTVAEGRTYGEPHIQSYSAKKWHTAFGQIKSYDQTYVGTAEYIILL